MDSKAKTCCYHNIDAMHWKRPVMKKNRISFFQDPVAEMFDAQINIINIIGVM